jgi:hypothetical protein
VKMYRPPRIFDGTYKDKVCQEYLMVLIKIRCSENILIIDKDKELFNSIYKDSCREYFDGRC